MSEVAPTLTSVTYWGENITVNWTDASTGVTINYYVVLIYQQQGGQNTPWGNYKTNGPVATLTFQPQAQYQFNPTLSYIAQVFAYSSDYPNGLGSTNTLPVANVILQPAITGIQVDGGNNVTVTWSDSTPYPGPNFYTILFSWGLSAKNFVTSNELSAFSWTFNQAPVLGPAAAYTATICGYYSAGTGPGPVSGSVNLLYQQLLPSLVSYDGATTVSVQWPAVTESGATSVSAFLTDQGVQVASSAGVTGTSTTITPPSALSPSQEYKVALQLAGLTTTGPMGPTVDVIVGSPTVQSASYSDNVLALSWAPVLQKAVLGFQVTLTNAQAATSTLYTRDATLTLPCEPAAIGGNTVSVAAVGFNSAGPPATATLVSATTEISSTGYAASTGIVTAGWTVSGTVPAAGAGYELGLFDGGSFVAGATTGNSASSGTLTQTLAGGRSYTARGRVTATANGLTSVGPWSGDAPVLVAAPVVIATSYDGARVTAEWSSTLEPGATAYNVSITGGASPFYEQVAGTRLDVAMELVPGTAYSLAVQSDGPSGSQGPSSNAVVVISNAPAIAATSYASGAAAVTWSVASPPTGALFELAIFDGGAFVASATSGNTATAGTITLALANGHAYTARGRMTAGLAIGPWGNEVPVLVAAPVVIATSYDGARVTAEWSSTLEPGVTAYNVALTGGVSPFYQQVAGTRLDVAMELVPGTAYTLTVQSDGPSGSQGPTSTGLMVISTAPEFIAVVYLAGVVTADWSILSPPGGVAFELAVFDGEGLVSSGLAGNDGAQGALTVALTAGRDYTARARMVSGGAIGPWGGAVPVLVGLPALVGVSWDHDTLALEWTSTVEPGVLGFQITVSDGSSNVLSAVVTGTSLSAPLVPAPTLNYTLSINTVGVVADGPAPAAATALISMMPAITSISYSGTVLSVNWTIPATAPSGTSYLLELYDGGGLVQTATNSWADLGQMSVTLAAGHDYSVRARMLTSDAVIFGPWSGLGPVLVGQPSLAITAYDGVELALGWNAVGEPGVRAYVVALARGGTNLAGTTVAGTSTSFPIALAAGSYTVGLNTSGGALTSGPTVNSTFTVPAAAAIAGVGYQGGVVSVSWSIVTGATSYLVELLSDYAPTTSLTVTSGATTATLTAAIDPDAIAHVRVTAITNSVVGAPSVPVRVLACAPPLTNVYYDGTNLNASWSAVAPVDAGAVTYTIAVTQGATTIGSTTSSTTSASFAVALPASGYTTQVQAVAGSSTGPWSAGVNPQIGDTEIFFSPTATSTPYVYRSSLRPPLPASLTAAPVTLYFPNLFNGAMPTNPPANNAFTLASVSSGVIQYSISVAAVSAWAFSAADVRTSLYNDYLAFLEWMEPFLKPGAMPFVQRALALGLPLSFAETLLYRYGFNPTSGYCDLAPGMRLRLDAESYQLIPGASPADLNGFVGASSAEYELMAGPLVDNVINVAFDSFLSLLGSTTVESANGGMGGVIDLYGTGGNKPYYRLFYPASFPAAASQGYSDPSRNVALVGASTVAALEAATTRYLSQGNFNGIPSSSVSVFYFRGRLVALPRVVVFADGEPCEISIGTSLRQLIGPACSLPFQEALPVTSIAVERMVGGVIDQPAQVASSVDIALSNPINFNDQTLVSYVYGDEAYDWFDLPLLGGDRVLVGGGA